MSRSTWALLCAVTCVSCSAVNYVDPRGPRYAGVGSPGDDPTPELVVVAFNIQYAQRIEEAIRALRTNAELQNSDLLLLQEMDRRGTRAIASALHFHYVYYPGSRLENGQQYGNAIVSRWPIVADGKVILPHRDPWDSRQRIAVRAIVETPRGQVLAYSVHDTTPWLSLRGRLEQAETILRDADRFDLPCVIGGDFNSIEAEAIRATVELFQLYAFRQATAHVRRTVDYPFGDLILDHVFVRGLRALEAGAPPTRASDHRPLWVRLRPP